MYKYNYNQGWSGEICFKGIINVLHNDALLETVPSVDIFKIKSHIELLHTINLSLEYKGEFESWTSNTIRMTHLVSNLYILE